MTWKKFDGLLLSQEKIETLIKREGDWHPDDIIQFWLIKGNKKIGKTLERKYLGITTAKLVYVKGYDDPEEIKRKYPKSLGLGWGEKVLGQFDEHISMENNDREPETSASFKVFEALVKIDNRYRKNFELLQIIEAGKKHDATGNLEPITLIHFLLNFLECYEVEKFLEVSYKILNSLYGNKIEKKELTEEDKLEKEKAREEREETYELIKSWKKLRNINITGGTLERFFDGLKHGLQKELDLTEIYSKCKLSYGEEETKQICYKLLDAIHHRHLIYRKSEEDAKDKYITKIHTIEVKKGKFFLAVTYSYYRDIGKAIRKIYPFVNVIIHIRVEEGATKVFILPNKKAQIPIIYWKNIVHVFRALDFFLINGKILKTNHITFGGIITEVPTCYFQIEKGGAKVINKYGTLIPEKIIVKLVKIVLKLGKFFKPKVFIYKAINSFKKLLKK